VEEHIIDTDGAAFNSRMMYKVGIQDMGLVGTEGSYEGDYIRDLETQKLYVS
jgi:hypothetical protein